MGILHSLLHPLRSFDGVLACIDDLLERSARGPWRDAPTAFLLLLPAFAIVGVFGIWPMFSSLHLSLYGGQHGLGGFVGLGNYARALSDDAFWHSLLVTVYYAVGTIPTTMILSFLVAYGLNRVITARGILRTAYFLPYVTSAVAAAMVWRALLGGESGMLNNALEPLGIPAQRWLLEPRGVLHLLTGGFVAPGAGPSLALCCVMAFEIWHGSGFMVVIFLAGLSAVPRELEEAARIDGANTRQLIRNVILPLLSPTIFFLLVVSTIKSFQSFNGFYALTNGRQMPDTQNLVLYIYATFYERGELGYGAAIATLLSLAIVLLTVVQWRYAGRRVHYE